MASFSPEMAKMTASGPHVVIGATGVIELHNWRHAIRMKYLFIAWLTCCQRLSGTNVHSVYFVFEMRFVSYAEGDDEPREYGWDRTTRVYMGRERGRHRQIE